MRGWLCLALAAPGVLSASAQDAVMRQGASIIFSAPDSDNVTSNLTTLSQKTSGAFMAASDALPISSGRTYYDGGNSATVIPMSAQSVRVLPARKDWTEQTPSEILNLATPESVLQISDSDAEALHSLQSSKSSANSTGPADNSSRFSSGNPASTSGGGWANLSQTLNVPTAPANGLFGGNNANNSTLFNFQTPTPAAAQFKNNYNPPAMPSAASSYQQLLQTASVSPAASPVSPNKAATFSTSSAMSDTTTPTPAPVFRAN